MTTHTTAQTTALITGANKGLGLETARRLAELGWTVWLGARSAEAGQAAADSLDGDVRFVPLDVTDDDSVQAAYATVSSSGTGLDVLINNAGVAHGVATLDTTPQDFLPTFGVNVLGPVRVTHAFLPLLTASSRPRLVMVSSGLGSLSRVLDPDAIESSVPGMVYQSSKSALNMIATQYAKALPDVQVSVVDPGYTATDLNGNSGHQTVTEGTDAAVTAAIGEDVPGSYFDRAGLVPW